MEKKETIIKLYELCANEMYHNQTPEVKRISKKVNKNISELSKTLTDEQRKLLDNIVNLYSDRTSAENKSVFVYAYSLATKSIEEGLDRSKH